MDWKFTIWDRYGTAYQIDEPVGFDADTIEIGRDLDWHGVFFENQGDSFEFRGDARSLLKEEYDTYGVQGQMELQIELSCGNGYEELSRNQFDFNKYDETTGDDCFIKITTEVTGEVMDLRNRINQKVNLETLKAFDETTDLPAYSKLPFAMTLPSKGIFIQDSARNDTNSYEHFLGITLPPTEDFTSASEYGMISLGLNKTVASEIGGFYVSSTPTYEAPVSGDTLQIKGTTTRAIKFDRNATARANWIWPLYLSAIVNYQEETANYGQIANPCNLSYRVAGTIKTLESWLDVLRLFFIRQKAGTTGEKFSDYEFIDVQDIYIGLITENISVDFDLSFSSDLTINQGDRFFLFIGNYNHKYKAQVEAGTDAFEITFNTNSFFKLTDLSKVTATECKVFAVNESISRVAETITNNRLKAYSEYFGRTDSQPYSHDSDGCGSLEVLTNGLRIRRQENKIVGQTNLFSLSLKDIFDGLAPIHNIGMGVEPDPNRVGYNRLRVENWKYFYDDTVIMRCIGVNKIRKILNSKDVFSTYQFGYEKYEAEEYTGLDEFLTKRTYRTTLNQVKNDFVKVSNLIASGYALEITRRKGNEDSKDWRYDKENFIICCERTPKFSAEFNAEVGVAGSISFDFIGDPVTTFDIGIGGSFTVNVLGSAHNDGTITCTGYTYVSNRLTFFVLAPAIVSEKAIIRFPDAVFPPGNLYVEIGNVLNPQNIIDPDTLYNYRISPVRNAMRWMNKVLASYKQFNPDAKIIFTDGTGNYYAKGEMESAVCRLENKELSENDTIDLTLYADDGRARPFLTPERVIYDFPMRLSDYKAIKANPKGSIYYEGRINGYGWIDTIVYRADEGMASFNLIPKNT